MFSVSQSATEMEFREFDPADCLRIQIGIDAMLTVPGFKQHLVVPLTNAATHVVLVRDDRRLNVLQCGTGTRSVRVHDNVKAVYPHIEFRSREINYSDYGRMFWNVLTKSCNDTYDGFSLYGVQKHEVDGQLIIGFNSHPDCWNRPIMVRSVYYTEYAQSMGDRLRRSINALCNGKTPSTKIVIAGSRTNTHFVVLSLEGSVINIVDIRMHVSTTVVQRLVMFPSDFGQQFPGFQFKSVQLSDAESNELIIKPIERRFWTLTKDFYIAPLRIAFAMGMHARLGQKSVVMGLNLELAAKIAHLASASVWERV